MPRQLTDEQREVLRQNMNKARAKAEANRLARKQAEATGEKYEPIYRRKDPESATDTATQVQETVTEDVALSQDAAHDELKLLAANLFRAASQREERAKAIQNFEEFLGKLNPKDYPEIAGSEIVQRFIEQLSNQDVNKDDPPGTVYNRGAINERKKSWTESDLRRSDIKQVDFEVFQPEVIIWNGLRRDYEPGIIYTDYRCFPDLMRERNRLVRIAGEHAEYLFRQRNTLSDTSVAGHGTARVRGSADAGSYIPAAGTFEPSVAAAEEETE